MALRDSEVDFTTWDLPNANTLTVGIVATFAQHEAERPGVLGRHWRKRNPAASNRVPTPANLTKEAR